MWYLCKGMNILVKLNGNIKKQKMKQITEKEVNVAPQSTQGHYIKNAKTVFCIDEVKEAFFIEGESIMTSHNHNTTPIKDSSLIIPQQVYNPFQKMMNRSQD